jgi:hypothetical protein
MLRSLRSFLPFLLASLGLAASLLVIEMPLFEWQISEIVTDLPSTSEDPILPSPWKAKFGQSLDDIRELLIFNSPCLSEDLKFVVRRSQRDETLERVSLNVYNNTFWLFEWGWIASILVIILSIIYMWWSILWYKQGAGLHAVIFTVLAPFICFFLSQIVRLARPGIPYYFRIAECHGTITFNAVLSRIHYEMPIALLAVFLLEVGALAIMLHQIIRAVIERKRHSSSAVD